MHTNSISLTDLNTFGLEISASELIEINSEESLLENLAYIRSQKFLILGGGSNLLFTKNFDGLIVLNRIKGIKLKKKLENEFIVEVGAGELWHDFVLFSLKNNWFGLENLSLIPGTVGATPIQNIGAYGVEIVDVLDAVDFIDIKTGKLHTLSNKECMFGYRESIFKNELKGTFIITKVRFKLETLPNLKLEYGAIKETLKERGISNPTPKDVSDAVIYIRSTKLPNPKEIGNCGSFFKNPLVSVSLFNQLKIKYPLIPSFYVDENHVKIPAAWLIDQLGWKGKTIGKIGVHKNQALVLVNYGGGSGEEIKNLAYKIIESVHTAYGILLTPEVNIV